MKKKASLIGMVIILSCLFFSVGLVKAADYSAQCGSSGFGYTSGSDEYKKCIESYTNAEKSSSGTTSTASSSGSSTSISFPNPIGASTLSEVLNKLLTNLKSVVIIVAVIFIIIGGLMYMLSGGNEKTITRAKACVAGAVIGLAIVLAAPIFLKEILTIFGGSSSSSGLNTSGLTSSLTLAGVAKNILNLLLSILGIVAIISLVVGGGMYLTAYGDEDRIKTAKKIVTYAIIGIVIALASLVIVQQVGNILGESVSSATIKDNVIGSILAI